MGRRRGGLWALTRTRRVGWAGAMVRRRGGLWVPSSRHGHQRETQRGTRLNQAGQQQGDACANGRLVETCEARQATGLRIGDRTHHRRGGEFGATRHQLGFQALCSLGCR